MTAVATYVMMYKNSTAVHWSASN